MIINDASFNLKNTNFTSGNQFTEGIPISVIQSGNRSSYIPNIYYKNSKYYIYAFEWSSSSGFGTLFMDPIKISCIVYYI